MIDSLCQCMLHACRLGANIDISFLYGKKAVSVNCKGHLLVELKRKTSTDFVHKKVLSHIIHCWSNWHHVTCYAFLQASLLKSAICIYKCSCNRFSNRASESPRCMGALFMPFSFLKHVYFVYKIFTHAFTIQSHC